MMNVTLWVDFLSNLQFNKHIATISAKANRIIKHTFSHIIIEIFRILSKLLVMSILEYCSSV